ETTSSGRMAREPLPADDYETNVISGGFGSALWSLVKVTAVLALFTLATVFTYLKWNDLLPWGQSGQVSVAMIPPAAAPKAPEKKPAPETAPPVSATPAAAPAKAEAAPEVTATVAQKEPEKKEAAKPKITASGTVEPDNDVDARDIEKRRAEAVRLARDGKFDEALAKFDALLAKSPKDGDALF